MNNFAFGYSPLAIEVTNCDLKGTIAAAQLGPNPLDTSAKSSY
jgi:hypothetical protein